jgi:hypothetical protein
MASMGSSNKTVPATSATEKAAFVAQLKGLATSQRRSRQSVFNTFEYFQLVSLLRQQHKITQYLSIDPDELNTWDQDTWETVQQQVKSYLDSLFRLQKTSSLPRLPTRDIDAHTAHLTSTFGEAAYGGIFVDTIDGYADITRSSSSLVDPVRRVLYHWLPDRLVARDDTDANMRAHYRAMGVEVASSELPLGPNDINSFVDGLARFLVALMGGAFLLVPIIVMSFTNSQNWRLVISSIAVITFAVFLSFLSEASNQEVLGGAAAYTAVMVVFVGSALSKTSGS